MGCLASRPANVDLQEVKIAFIENPDILSKAKNIQEQIREKTKSVDIHTWRENQDFNEFHESTIKHAEPHVFLYIFPYMTTVVDGDIEKVKYIKQVLGKNSENYILPVVMCEDEVLIDEEQKQNLMIQVQDKLKLERFCGIGKNETPEDQVNKLMEKINEVVDGNHNESYKWKPVTDPKDQPKASRFMKNCITPLL